MALTLVTAPTPVVTLAEAKAHLRVDSGDEDTQISAFVAAATSAIDGRDGWLGRAIGTQTWDWKLWGGGNWPNRYWQIPLPPLQSVTSITCRAPGGTATALDPARYRVSGIGGQGLIELLSGSLDLDQGADALVIRFVAGYATVPPAVRAAILLTTARLYHNRGDVAGPGEDSTVAALLSTFRVWS